MPCEVRTWSNRHRSFAIPDQDGLDYTGREFSRQTWPLVTDGCSRSSGLTDLQKQLCKPGGAIGDVRDAKTLLGKKQIDGIRAMQSS